MLRRSILISLFLLLLSVACVSRATPPVSTPIPSPSATPPPTATPALPLAILVLPENMDENASKLYQATVYELAQSAGIRYQLRNRLSVDDLALEPALKVVIAVNADIDLPTVAPM